MPREQLLKNLMAAETCLECYMNKHKEPKLVNRFKKFWRHPYKYLYLNAYKSGLHHITDYPVEMFWGDSITLPLSDENSAAPYYCGSLSESECRLARYFIQTLGPEDIFYDVGANFGFYSLLAHALGVKEIHAFEPSDVAMRYVRQNAPPNMYLNEVAVADTVGTQSFYDLSPSNKGQMSSLIQEFIPEQNRKNQRIITVETTTLDEYSKTHRTPTVIKMDIENSESLALSGAETLLREHAPLIAMEVSDSVGHLERTKKALAMLEQARYRAYKITEEGTLAPESMEGLGSFGEFNERVFVKKEV